MQADVAAFLALDMDADFLARQVGTVLLLLRLGPDHVIGCGSRYALREFAAMVGIEFPAGLLFIDAADLYLHAINRLIALPDSSENEGVGLNMLAGVERGGKGKINQQSGAEVSEV